jgi:hypothetical protein
MVVSAYHLTVIGKSVMYEFLRFRNKINAKLPYQLRCLSLVSENITFEDEIVLENCDRHACRQFPAEKKLRFR